MSQPHRHLIYNVALVIACISIVALCACTVNESRSVAGYGWLKLQTQVSDIAEAPLQSPLSLTIATIDGSYSGTWDEADKLSPYETFLTGQYIASAVSGMPDAEGYGCQCYTGNANFTIIDGNTVPAELMCTLQQALVYTSISSQTELYSIDDVTLHTSGYNYNSIDMQSSAPILVMPGSTQCFVTLSDNQGKTVTVSMPGYISTIAADKTQAGITASDDKIVITTQNSTQEFPVTAAIWQGSAPIITTQGFESGKPISLIEGYPSSQPLIMDISSDLPLQSATLTLKGRYLIDQDIPTDCDLLDMPQHLADMGLKVTHTAANTYQIDFTQFIENLNVDFNDQLEFSVEAIDSAGRVADVATLAFTILSMDLQVVSVEPAVLGENYAVVTIALSVDQIEGKDFSAYVETAGVRKPIDVMLLNLDSQQKLATVGFYIPDGIDPVDIAIEYMDVPKLKFAVPRRVPEFSISVDPFAHSAIISLDAGSEAKTDAICKYANVYANGQRTTIVKRDAETSSLKVIGLQPSQQYDLVVEVIDNQFAAAAKTVTESEAGVPMGDFEDFEFTYDFKRIPSGGAYSSAAFPIYNNQNFTDFSGTWVTKYWASVNDKTLCKAAKRYNTWYMQPSAMLDFDDYASGLKSMHLVSVGWSLDGPEIPPYMQSTDKYIGYNGNAPSPDHVSAGKLFLGSYSFDPSTCTEVYNQGIEFGSRPSSLNGFYKYLPDINHDTDQGLVTIDLINDMGAELQVIAHAEMKLGASPDFVSFNLPIEYSIPNLKATRLKIMFASSAQAGSIEAEDASVPVSADIEHARYVGSELWIDNLSFTY